MKAINPTHNNYRIYNKKNKKTYDINVYGEYHKQTKKINLIDKYLKLPKEKTIFYCENPFSFYDKKYKYYPYFREIDNTKYGFTDFNKCNGYFDNLIYFRKYFAYYYKKNNYVFKSKYDINYINNSKPYPKYLTYKPLDFRDGKCGNFGVLDTIDNLILYYFYKNNIIIKYQSSFKTFYKEFFGNKVNNYIQTLINNCNLKYEDLLLYYNTYFKEYIKVDDNILRKIFLTRKKYYNKELLNFCNNMTDNNFNKYMNSINLTNLIIDQFNTSTFFLFSNDIDNTIKSFYNYFINSFLINTNEFDLIFGLFVCSLFDIMIFINFNKDFGKYDNYVIYCGDDHRKIYNLYFNHYVNYINYNKYYFI